MSWHSVVFNFGFGDDTKPGILGMPTYPLSMHERTRSEALACVDLSDSLSVFWMRDGRVEYQRYPRPFSADCTFGYLDSDTPRDTPPERLKEIIELTEFYS